MLSNHEINSCTFYNDKHIEFHIIKKFNPNKVKYSYKHHLPYQYQY
jgi:hypothetical protein